MKTKPLLSALTGIALACLACPAVGMATDLDDYVAAVDANYSYRHYHTSNWVDSRESCTPMFRVDSAELL